jgi:ribosomal protein L16 Arg81 hydroxylase
MDASLLKSMNLWYSQRESRIPLHWDTRDNVLAQVRGAKSVKLYAPDQSENLYPGLEGEMWASQVDMDAPDLRKHPKFTSAKVAAELTLREGEMLYIPRCWWHHIITVSEVSLSVNYWFDRREVNAAPLSIVG